MFLGEINKPDFWVRAASWGVDGASLGFPRPPQIRKKRGDGGTKNTINVPIFLLCSVMGRENTPPYLLGGGSGFFRSLADAVWTGGAVRTTFTVDERERCVW